MIASVVDRAISLYSLLIFVYIILSWLPASGTVWEIRRMLGTLVEPYLGLFRRIVPPMGMIDITPIVAIFVLQYVIRTVLMVVIAGLGV